MMRVFMTGLSIWLCFLVAAAAGDAPAIPDTESGRRIAAYLGAFNSGDPARMATFFKEQFAPKALAERGVDERVKRWEEAHEMLGGLTPVRLVEATDASIVMEIRCGNGDVPTFTFEFEPQAPHKFTAIQARLGGPEESSTLPDIPPAGLDVWLAGLTDENAFSGVVVARKGGKTVFEKAYGMADRSSGTPNRLDTKFNLGSINKIMTKIAIARLAEQGKIEPGDTIGKFLPDYPNRDAAAKVTVRQLVGHKGAVGDFFNERFDATPHSEIRTIPDYLTLFADKPLEFPPGTKSKYSNGGYVVLGAIVAKVSGMPYEEFIRESILRPASMNDTMWISVDEIVPNRAVGYTRHADTGGPPEGELRANTFTLPGRGSPAGGGYATAADLIKMAIVLQDGVLLTKPWAAWILEGGDAPWPAPATKDTPRGRINIGGIGFAGGAQGVSAVMEWELDADIMVVVLANLDPPIAPDVAAKVMKWVGSRP